MSRLPNLVVIGAMKCGTGSLHYYLGLHPQIFMSKTKELNFFIKERNWHKGIQWYKSNFTEEAQIYGESSPDYTNYPYFDGVPPRMYSVVPDAKLIYVLRDPITRIISHYIHESSVGRENRELLEALTESYNNPYICRSKYYMQLEQFLEYFPKSNILIITTEELHIHRRQTLQKLFRFLNVDESFYGKNFSNLRNESRYRRRKNWIGMLLTQLIGMQAIEKIPILLRRIISKPFSHKIERPTLDAKLRQDLTALLKEDIDRLRKLSGYNFEYWCL